MTLKLMAAFAAVTFMSTSAFAAGGEKDQKATGAQQEGLMPEGEMQEGAIPEEETQETTIPGEEAPQAQPGAETEQMEPTGEAPEAAVPRDALSAQGEITRIDQETGWMTLQTVEGAELQLHANPEEIQAAQLQEGQEIMAQYEMRGTMRHVTKMQPMGEKKKPEGQKPME